MLYGESKCGGPLLREAAANSSLLTASRMMTGIHLVSSSHLHSYSDHSERARASHIRRLTGIRTRKNTARKHSHRSTGFPNCQHLQCPQPVRSCVAVNEYRAYGPTIQFHVSRMPIVPTAYCPRRNGLTDCFCRQNLRGSGL
jgi:hypothetical protein